MTLDAMEEHRRRQAEDLRPTYDVLPSHIRGGIRNYIERGDIPGGFLQAVLCNNLVQSFGRADEINREHMFDITVWLYNSAPGQSWGSEEKMRAWAAHQGLSAVPLS